RVGWRRWVNLQQQAQNAFDAASNALKNGQGQSNYGQLTQQILAGLNKGQLDSGIKPLEIRKFTSYGGDILENLDRNADRGVPNFDLLSTFGSSMSRAITGVSNLTLLSSTNNALMDNILGYMQNVADSMRNERQFSQNGQQALMDAHHLKTKTITTKDKYSGEEIGTTYVLDENGNIRMFTDEDGELKQMTVGDWITSKEVCGANLTNAGCNQYTERTYESVEIDSKGNITAHRNIYNGSSNQCGADATQSESYCYGESDRIVTIAPPNPKALLLGRGASRLGDIFDSKENGIGDLVNASFGNLNSYLSSNKYTAGLFNEVKNAQMENDHNASIAANEVNNKVKIANLIASYAESVLYGGMKTGQWIANQSRQAIQDVVATALSNAFDLPPDAAALLSGGLITHLEADRAKHHLGSRHLGLGKHLDSIEGRAFGMVSGGLYDIGLRTAHTNDLAALNRWKEFKNSMVGFAVQKYGESQHWSPEFSGFASQYVSDYFQMKQAKEELGRRSGAFSMNSVLGEIKVGLANVGGAIGEVRGALINGTAHIAGDLGLTSERYEREINQNVRTAINDIKLKHLKDDIRTWSADQVGLASATVKEYGKQNNWDQAKIEMWSGQASDFVVRHQAEREIHKRDNLLLGGNPALFLDRKLFNGGLTSLITKGYRGVATTLADVGNLLGEGVVSSAFRNSVYDQTRDWRNTITQEDVKARTGQGIINKSYIETEMRNKLFDVIGETLIPGDKEAAHNLGLLLKHHIDEKEQKKQAKEQRLRDAQTIVQVAAAAAAMYFTAGAASGAANSWLSTLAIQTGTATTASVGGVSTVVATGLTNGQILALAASTAVSMGVEGSINGTNGAIAALANGIISAATMGVRTPVTGYVTYTKHQNADLLLGRQEVRGGLGGGFNLNLAAAGNPSIQGFMNALKMTNLSLGLSYNQDAGLGMNLNSNFTSKLGLGLDYNFKSGNYTANASYDFDKVGGKDWANASLGISASKTGQSNLTLSYNNDDGGESKIPQRLRGQGATLDFGNDGLVSLSIQGLKGATVANISYNTNSHGFEDLKLNGNFQNEFNQGLIAEHSHENLKKQQMELLKPMVGTGIKMGLYSQAEIDQTLPRDGKGGIDMEKSDPSKLLAKWDHYKNSMSGSEDSIKIWKEQVTRAGEEAGVKIRFNEGKSATTTFGKFVTGLFGDVAQSFGFANDGSKMVDKQGVFHLDTCFTPGSKITRLKNKNIRIYGNMNSSEDSFSKANTNKTNSNEFSSNDYEFTNIEDVKIGDVVRSWNENTNTFENKRVTETFVHEVPQLFFLELDGEEEIHTTWNHPFRRQKTDEFANANSRQRTEDRNGVDITSRIANAVYGDGRIRREFEQHSVGTEKHSRNVALEKRNSDLSEVQSSEWVKVEDLRLRDQVLRSDGSWGTVTGIYYYNTEPTKVYNLEVEDNHTYIVGGDTFGIGYVVHNYTEQVQRILDGKGILSEDSSKMLDSANVKDKLRALGKVNEFDYAGSKWKNVGSDENGVAHFQSESNKYGLKEDLYFRNNNGKIEIEQVQHLNGKEYSTKNSNLDVLKQTVIAVNLKSTNDYLTHLSNVLGERGGSGTKYDDGTPKVSLVKDANGQAKLNETKNGLHTVEIERNGNKGRMVVEEVGRTQREARSDYSGERGLIKKYDLNNPLERRAYDAENDTPTQVVPGGDHLRDVAVCQSTVIAEDRHNNGRTVGEVAKAMGDFAASRGLRPSQLGVLEISQALKKDGLQVGADIYFQKTGKYKETREQFNDRFFEFAKGQLDQGMAVNVGGTYANSLGHVTRITGYVEGPHGERGFMINDSYGDANKGYRSGAGGQDGRAVFYPIDKLNVAQFNYAYTIVEDTGTNTPSGNGSSSGSRRRNSSGGFWNKFSNIFKFDFFKKD
ncbi:toxin HINT domain protein, partial [Leptospira kirschneri str. 200803703]|uniref:TIGR04388 family protein n=1 Tax=Leptospira kirschneri TaxID=29507 RepID=UPI0002C034F6